MNENDKKQQQHTNDTKAFPEMNMKTENIKILFNSKDEHKL